MSKKVDIDWKNTPHILDLLSYYRTPSNIEGDIKDERGKYILEGKLTTKDTIEYFIREGLLIDCDLFEKINCAYKVDELKKLLKDYNLKVSGKKSDLINRLKFLNQSELEQLVEKFKIMKCSPSAIEYLDYCEEKKQKEKANTKQKCLMALMNGDPKIAYKYYNKYDEEYGYSNHNYYDDLDPFQRAELKAEQMNRKIEEMKYVLMSKPDVLRHLDEPSIKMLRASVCMDMLWHQDFGTKQNWLPENFSTGHIKIECAANYLRCNAKFRKLLSTIAQHAEKVRIVFNENDITSCDHCSELNGKIFNVSDFPNLPLDNCTSDTGCRCQLEAYEYLYYDDDTSHDIDYIKLKQLRKMMDHGLITEDEYEKKKAEILARM